MDCLSESGMFFSNPKYPMREGTHFLAWGCHKTKPPVPAGAWHDYNHSSSRAISKSFPSPTGLATLQERVAGFRHFSHLNIVSSDRNITQNRPPPPPTKLNFQEANEHFPIKPRQKHVPDPIPT